MTEVDEENNGSVNEEELKKELVEELEKPDKTTVWKRKKREAGWRRQFMHIWIHHRFILIGIALLIAGTLYWLFL